MPFSLLPSLPFSVSLQEGYGVGDISWFQALLEGQLEWEKSQEGKRARKGEEDVEVAARVAARMQRGVSTECNASCVTLGKSLLSSSYPKANSTLEWDEHEL